MAYIEEKQLSIFDLLEPDEPELKPGDWVEEHGQELTFEQITQMVGQLIIMDMSTESHEWLKVVLVEDIIWNEGQRRLIYYDGGRQRGLVNERYFDKSRFRFPDRAYMLAGQTVPFPCENCVFDNHGRCDHIEDRDCFCVNGSFQITRESAKCPGCGRRMEITQSDYGSDGGRCRKCGMNVIFNNRGNRKTAMELWQAGELVGK